ncbi:hypothetical protein G6F24_018014 [Rhizopus arrhizus]|nr:hypothetical protein G6F24_018014 [Rhizopus arrhizus]
MRDAHEGRASHDAGQPARIHRPDRRNWTLPGRTRAKAACGLDRSPPYRAGSGLRFRQDGGPEFSVIAPAVQPAQHGLSIADRPVA